MSKNILVLTGSPRRGGNSDLMANAFIKGAEAAGHNVTKFEAAFKKLSGCRACDTCWSKGTACSIQDDFTKLAELYETSDVLVISTPLYWYSFPAQLKMCLDRMYAYYMPDCKRPLKIKECALMVCAGTEAAKDFDGIIKSYQACAEFIGWKDLGIIKVPNVNAKGDILNTDALTRAEALGSGITD
ncbi:flavodoxin family protein [Acetanaerobacterium elongatum]|uniref:NADPH-dependent FMN reductase n=1 Tax=Acetanaerobacterium elongatum TaxID=258515 RepID=A0A1G9UQ03_9FIRM|nr:flavodoxin family protein [Acetanaerobacterium elongatum]SDM61635.1 NADPH-dependent FMN reductase [Acetanaerobacterium elongatum]